MDFTGTTTRHISEIEVGSFLLKDFTCDAIREYDGEKDINKKIEFGFYDIVNKSGWYFSFNDGKIYDPEGRMFYSFDEKETFSLSGNFINNSYEYYINDSVFCNIGEKVNLNFNAWKMICREGSSAKGDVYIKSSEFKLDLDMIGVFDYSGIWSGDISHNHDHPISIWSGDLTEADSAFFTIFSGLDFEEGKNIIEAGTSRPILIKHNPTVAREEGVFTLGVKAFTDFGSQTMVFSGFGDNLSVLDVTTNLSPSFASPLFASNDFPSGKMKFTYTNFIESGDAGLIDHPIKFELSSDGSQPYAAVTSFVIENSGTYDPTQPLLGYFDPLEWTIAAPDAIVELLTGAHPDFTNSGVGVTGFNITSSGVYGQPAPSFVVDGTLASGPGANEAIISNTWSTYTRNIKNSFDLFTGIAGGSVYPVTNDIVNDYPNILLCSATLASNENLFNIEVHYSGLNQYDNDSYLYYLEVSGFPDSLYNIDKRTASGYVQRQ